MSTPPNKSDESDDIDDFFTPEEEQTLDKETTRAQTADTTAAATGLAADQPQGAVADQQTPVNSGEPAANRADQSPPADQSDLPAQSEEQPTALSKVPITLHVEVARLSISLQQVLDLKPGAVLSLEKEIGQTVDLVVEGRRIGAAELMRIGENLGLRIVQLH